jgi:hypothetical protein
MPVTPLPTPPASANADAVNRAIRTWIGGIISAALTAAGPGLLVLFGAIRWTPTYWATVGGVVLSAFLTGAVSYAMRHLAPPQ